MKKILLGAFGVALVFGGIGFYSGAKYAGSSPRFPQRNMQGFSGLSPDERQVRFNQFGGMRGGGARLTGDSFVSGKVVTKDNTSMTVILPDNSSKIIFYSTSTSVVKNTTTTPLEVKEGQEVIIVGTTNTDGSLSARNIQLRESNPR